MTPTSLKFFGRINSISKSLNPQEKRNARFSGEFKQFCLRQAAARVPFWRSTEIFTATEISRMQEVQFVSDLTINLMEGLTDYSPSKIDSFYEQYDEDFPDEPNLKRRMERIFRIVTVLSPALFKDTIFRSSQVAFSLLMTIDQKPRLTSKRVEDLIQQIDEKIVGFSQRTKISGVDSELLSGFTGGNLHRIKARRIRAKALDDVLA